MSKMVLAQQAVKNNDPPIEVNQRWVCYNKAGEVFRRVRILAPHPDGGWLFVDEASILQKRRLERYIGVFPEFNLRYVMELEK